MFRTIYFLHGRGGSPTGSSVATIASLLREHISPETEFVFLDLPHSDPNLPAEESYRQFSATALLEPESLLIGVSLGGLVAAKYCEDHPEMNLRVVALASPTESEGLALESVHSMSITALYSRLDPVIGYRANWERCAYRQYDVPWMQDHRLENHKYSVALFLLEYLNNPKNLFEVLKQIHEFPVP